MGACANIGKIILMTSKMKDSNFSIWYCDSDNKSQKKSLKTLVSSVTIFGLSDNTPL